MAILCALTFAACAQESDPAPGTGAPEDPIEWRRHAAWTSDAHGTWFRYASEGEVQANDWPSETWLVWYPPADVRRNAELPVVIDSSSLEYAPLFSAEVWSGTNFHELDFSASIVSTTLSPTLYRLNTDTSALPPGELAIDGHVMTDDLGGLYALVSLPGGTSTNPAREILANERNAKIDSLALPDGTVPPPQDLLVVSAPPAGPNLPSGSETEGIPLPTVDVFPLVLFGNMNWCQRHPTNWVSLIGETAFEIRAGFRKDQPGPDETDTGWDLVLATSWCFFYDKGDTSDVAKNEAKFCEWGLHGNLPNPDCDPHTCTDGQGVAYPFTGCYRKADCYLDNLWDAVEYADVHLALPDIMVAQVLAEEKPQDSGAQTIDCPEDAPPNTWVCGKAGFGGVSVTTAKPYLAWDTGLDGCSSPFTWTHEVGHNFMGMHHGTYENAPAADPDCKKYETLMNTSQNPPPGTCEVNWFREPEVLDMKASCTTNCPRAEPYVDHLP